MSHPAIRLPLRTLTKAQRKGSQWICRRCLATTASPPPTTNSIPPPPPLSSQPPHERLTHIDPAGIPPEDYNPHLPGSQRHYKLFKTDFYLKKGLPQEIPEQYLQHSTSALLPLHEQAAREKTRGHKRIVGVVVSAGKMDKTVRVRVPRLVWNNRVKKHFQLPTTHLVHDPNNSLQTGDVISLHRLRVSTIVHHVVASLITPFSTPVSERPPIPTPDERLAKYKEKRFAKLHRRELRRKAAMGDAAAIKVLEGMGLDPGKGVEAGKGQMEGLEKGTGKKRTPAKGAILGRKGQKLPAGVLPGGLQEVGGINERASKNKGQAMKFRRQAEVNLLEAERKGEELARRGLATPTGLPTQGPMKREATGKKGE